MAGIIELLDENGDPVEAVGEEELVIEIAEKDAFDVTCGTTEVSPYDP